MKIILHNIIKKKTIKLLSKIGNGINEVMLNVDASVGDINSLEINEDGEIITHIFNLFSNDSDTSFMYDDLNENDKLSIYENLKNCLTYR